MVNSPQTIDQAIVKYENIAKMVFAKPCKTPAAMFDHTELEHLVKEAVTELALELKDDTPLADEAVSETYPHFRRFSCRKKILLCVVVWGA
jgi:hypothetical protein